VHGADLALVIPWPVSAALPHAGCARRADLQLEVLRLVGAAWDARPDAPCAAAELREWASYCGVCRAWRAHFAGRPLRLAFDAPLTRAQVTRRPPLRRPFAPRAASARCDRRPGRCFGKVTLSLRTRSVLCGA